MAKAKNSKGSASIQNKVLYSRVSYLYQAASYLSTQRARPEETRDGHQGKDAQMQKAESSVLDTAQMPTVPQDAPHTEPEGASRCLISDLRSVAHKTQMRLAPAMRHTICKNCDSLLLDGSSCSTVVENKSKGGKKPWADVLVRKCNACGIERRYPLAATRQKRKTDRKGLGTTSNAHPVS